MAKSLAFTTRANDGLLRELVSEVSISPAFNPADDETGRIQFSAIWDTGATASVITDGVAKSCGLKPIGKTIIAGVGSTSETDVYMIDLGLPNRLLIQGLKVCRADIAGASDVLIGMDVITNGDFSVTNFKGNTVFSFRHPSSEVIDFVQSPRAKVGRNDPCHCGSQKKYKLCCGKRG